MAAPKAPNSNKLNSASRAFIVKQIACFATPKETAELLNEEFGIEITPQGVERYDHTKYAGRKCSKRWRDLYELTRAAFLKHVELHVPEVNKAVRLRGLSQAARQYRISGNYMGMAAMFERIAKEVGGSYTNRFEHTGKKGGPIQYQPVAEMTNDDLRDELLRNGIDPDSIRPGTSITKH